MTQDLNRRQFSAGLVLAPLAAGGLLTGCNSMPDTLRIGVAQPISGPIAALGQDLLNGVTLAVRELNEAGFNVDGKRITFEILSVDDKADVEVGKQVAQKLVDGGIVAVIGHLNSGVSIAAAPIYAGHGIAQLAISTNPKYTELGFPTTFRMVANDNLQAAALASYAVEQLGGKRYAAFDDGTPYGKDLAGGAAKRLEAAKKTVALRQSFDETTVAFDELAAKLKSENVDVVISTLNDYQVLALLQALKKINYTSLRLLGSDTVKTTDMEKGADIVDGLYASSPVLEAKEFTAGPQFLDKYGAAFGKPPAYGAHYTYDSMYVLSQAIQLAKSAKPADITAALHKINGYAPVTGTMKWDDKGEQRYGAVGVYELRRGSWELRMRSDRW
ncbi:MAG: branched-chain amino acid ABC transporter substrate-binding protein [Giesbergeria sp.]